MPIRVDVDPRARDAIAHLLRNTPEFNEEEVATALELVDDALANPETTYRLITLYDDDDALLGYLCYGRTPMTRFVYDLYWLATERAHRGKGVGRQLVDALYDILNREHSRWTIRVETGTRELYAPTIAFYRRLGFDEAGRIRDFYDVGDDLLTLVITRGDVAA